MQNTIVRSRRSVDVYMCQKNVDKRARNVIPHATAVDVTDAKRSSGKQSHAGKTLRMS